MIIVVESKKIHNLVSNDWNWKSFKGQGAEACARLKQIFHKKKAFIL